MFLINTDGTERMRYYFSPALFLERFEVTHSIY